MRRFALLVACGCGRVAFNPLADARGIDTASDSLLFDFEFESDGLFVDRSAYHRQTSCTTCPTAVIDPMRGNVASFPGGTDLLVLNTNDLRPAAFTISVWGVTSTDGTMFARARGTGATNENTIEIIGFVGSVSLGVNFDYRTQGIAPGVWHHIAGVFDGDVVTFYVDGLSMAWSVGPAFYTDELGYFIACDYNFGAPSCRFVGLLDSVRFYGIALDPSEIAQLAAM